MKRFQKQQKERRKRDAADERQRKRDSVYALLRRASSPNRPGSGVGQGSDSHEDSRSDGHAYQAAV